jgi:hypothetical protein
MRIRTLRFRDRLAVCVVAAPLLVLGARYLRADDDCTFNKEKKDVCQKSGHADCNTYGESDCSGKSMTVIYDGKFFCVGNGTNRTKCFAVVIAGKAQMADCTKEFECIVCEFNNTKFCAAGNQLGNTNQQVLMTSDNCDRPTGGGGQ